MSFFKWQLIRFSKRDHLLTLLFGIAQIPIFGVLNFLYSHRPVADPSGITFDVQIYFDGATAVLNGQLPYRDFFLQYPPLSLLFFIPPRLFAADLAGYFTWFNVELLILAWIGLAATAAIAQRLRQPLAPTLLVYSLALLAVGSLVPQRYDLAPAVLVALALTAWPSERRGAAWALLALGMLTKVYPALLFPLFTVAEWRRAGKRAVWRGWLIFGGLIGVGLLPFLLLAPRETLNALGGQVGRGLSIQSTYASLLLVSRSIGVPAEIVYHRQLNSWDVIGPHSDLLVLAATALQLVLLGLVYLRFLRAQDSTNPALVRYSAAAIGVGLVTSKVFSAQFILWLFPLAFLSGDKRFVWTSALFLAGAFMTQMLSPFLFGELKQGAILPLLVALGRDLCLVALCFLLLRAAPDPIPAPRVMPQTAPVRGQQAE
jgi:hypothetical protein